MKTLLKTSKVFAFFSLIGLIVVFGLHHYHYSFDPYSWLKSNAASVESRDLWNVRKDLYRFWTLIFLIGTIFFGFLPVVGWLVSFRKIRLK